MKLTKSIKILLISILLLIVGLIVTRQIISHSKWLFYRISAIDNTNRLVEKTFVNLDGTWSVKSEDSIPLASPGIIDKDWNTDRFLYLALLKTAKKVKWMRKHFICPPTVTSDTLLVKLSLFDIQAEVYVNGNKITDSCCVHDGSICCYLPAHYLIKGKDNIIAVRAATMMPNPDNAIAKFTDEILTIVKPTIDLQGYWKFATGDKENWQTKDFSDTSFKTIYVPKFWDNQGYKTYDGIAWYRKKFTSKPGMRTKQLVFISGKIDDFGEVYINGQKIGGQIIKSKDINITEWDTYCLYPFNGTILSDTNTVAIRVLDNQLRGGIYQGPIGILTMDDYLKFIEIKK